MKNFIQLVIDKSEKFLSYKEKNKPSPELFLLQMFVHDSLPYRPLRWLKYSDSPLYETNDLIEIERKNNSITFKMAPDRAKEYSNLDTLTITLDSFSMMLRNWEKLRNQKAPSIFFVQDSHDTIAVRESLEIKKEKTVEERTIKTKPGMFQRLASAFSFTKKEKRKYLMFEHQVVNKNMGLKMYRPDHKTMNSDLGILGLVFGISDREEIARYLEDESQHCYETNIFRIRKDGASVIIDQPEHYQCRDKLVLSFYNFQNMLQEWDKLTGNRVQKLYFIQEPNGTISTKDQLG